MPAVPQRELIPQRRDWKRMKKSFMVCAALFCGLIACGKEPLPPQGKSENRPAPEVVVEKEKIGEEQPLPPEVKIKLKKDGKDSFSWEITGSDVDQVLKVNEKLRKQLGGGQAR
jgi:hypothetical protein